MAKLMRFRKDEFMIQENPDEVEYTDCDEIRDKKQEQNVQGPDQAYELVVKAEQKMMNINKCLKGIDKRMSYNSRLIGSIIVTKSQENEIINIQNQEEFLNVDVEDQ